MEILVDTREQLPLWKGDRVTLNIGDYTTTILRKRFVIERKSASDLYDTMLRGHKRFRKQIMRAKEQQVTMVVFVECSQTNFLNQKYNGAEYARVSGTTVMRIIRTISKRYGIEFVWASNRAAMKAKLRKRLAFEEAQLARNSGKRPRKFAPR